MYRMFLYLHLHICNRILAVAPSTHSITLKTGGVLYSPPLDQDKIMLTNMLFSKYSSSRRLVGQLSLESFPACFLDLLCLDFLFYDFLFLYLFHHWFLILIVQFSTITFSNTSKASNSSQTSSPCLMFTSFLSSTFLSTS